MGSVEMYHQVDLETGNGDDQRRRSAASNHVAASDEEGSACFSDADDVSSYSQFYSTVDGSYNDYGFGGGSDPETEEIQDSQRHSSVAQSDYCSVDIERGVLETELHSVKVEKDCRICHLGLESTCAENGIGIELGCSCKNDLAAVHKHCAEAWFKIKGNEICEICNSVARNIAGANDVQSAQQTNETVAVATNTASAMATSTPTTENPSFINGHRLLNFLLAFMVTGFVISWLFHFNIPS